jgi:hypothetical protein
LTTFAVERRILDESNFFNEEGNPPKDEKSSFLE